MGVFSKTSTKFVHSRVSWGKLRKDEDSWEKLRKVEERWGKLRKVEESGGNLREVEESWEKFWKVQKNLMQIEWDMADLSFFTVRVRGRCYYRWWFVSFEKSAVISDVQFFAYVGSETFEGLDKLRGKITGTMGALNLSKSDQYMWRNKAAILD